MKAIFAVLPPDACHHSHSEDSRDKANGIVGTTTGIIFLITSAISGFLVGHSGMYLVLILAMLVMAISIADPSTMKIPENEIVHIDGKPGKVDLRGTFAVVVAIPGLIAG